MEVIYEHCLCDEVLAMNNLYDAFQDIENQDARFYIQIQKDKEICCTINKAYILEKQHEEGTSTTAAVNSSTKSPQHNLSTLCQTK